MFSFDEIKNADAEVAKAMEDELGRSVLSAGPSKPVSVTGLVEVPFAGEKFMVLNDERKAREIAEVRAQNKFNEEKGVGKAASLTDLRMKMLIKPLI